MLKENITQRYLQDWYTYDPDTGVLAHKYSHTRVKAGDRAGSLSPNGYWTMSIGKKTYAQHRVIWLYMTGEWPSEDVDHINLDPSDNRWENLRQVTHSENCRNNKASKKEFYGVYWQKQNRNWIARIDQNHIGVFTDKRDARDAVQAYLRTQRCA